MSGDGNEEDDTQEEITSCVIPYDKLTRVVSQAIQYKKACKSDTELYMKC